MLQPRSLVNYTRGSTYNLVANLPRSPEALLANSATISSYKLMSVQQSQYCQTRSVNILTRVCRELTRLSRSKHTLVKILTIGQLEHPQMTLDDPPFLDHRKLKLACRNMIVKKKIKKIHPIKSFFSDFLSRPWVCRELTRPKCGYSNY